RGRTTGGLPRWQSALQGATGRPTEVLPQGGRMTFLTIRGMPVSARRDMLERRILPELGEPIRYSPELQASLADLISSVRAQGLEGLVAKRRDSRYEPGRRSGAWQKMRINKGQEFVIAGYTVGGSTFDALVFGYYQESNLLYVSRTRNGFTPRVREELME